MVMSSRTITYGTANIMNLCEIIKSNGLYIKQIRIFNTFKHSQRNSGIQKFDNSREILNFVA